MSVDTGTFRGKPVSLVGWRWPTLNGTPEGWHLSLFEQPLRGLSSSGGPVPIQLTGVSEASLPYRAGCALLQTSSYQEMLLVCIHVEVTQLKEFTG